MDCAIQGDPPAQNRSVEDERKSAGMAGPAGACPIERRPDGSVRVGSFALARQVLRACGTRQAGFRADLMERFPQKNMSVLFQEGEAHQKQRAAAARFFAPRVVTRRYRTLMAELSDRLVDDFRRTRRAELDQMSLQLAVAVAAEIVGLTESSRSGMARRLNRFFTADTTPKAGRFGAPMAFLRSQLKIFSFYLFDVRPAISARHAEPREDVISHLVEQGWSGREILTECLTYGAAGMATTREFVVMAAWHLLERGDMRRRFLGAGEAERTEILEEILRLEPVVGSLYRRTERPLTLDTDGATETIPTGTKIVIDIRGANGDIAVTGACPHRLDPDRARPDPRAVAPMMSFGDGPHRCPGASVALQEASMFLDRLLRVPNIRLERAPTIAWNGLTMGYELRNAVIVTD